jgi:hypothetical protein
MKVSTKILLVIILLSVLLNIITVFYYENQLKPNFNEETIVGGLERNRKYTAQEIIRLIKNSSEYIGDSLVIYSDGKIISDNSKLQGTIDAVSINDKEAIDKQTIELGLPKPLLVYKLAAHYYRAQYPDEFRNDQ